MEEGEEMFTLGFLPCCHQTKFWALLNPKYILQLWREATDLWVLMLELWVFDACVSA